MANGELRIDQGSDNKPGEFVAVGVKVDLFGYYKGIFTNAALEQLTGINQKQMQYYAAGLKRPRPQQLKKIEAAFHLPDKELITVRLSPPGTMP